MTPANGASVTLQAPNINTGTTNVSLKMPSEKLEEHGHAVLLLAQAGWHKTEKLIVPDNLTILYLPPYSPELNPLERVWAYLRSHYLANRGYDGYDHLLHATAHAWQQRTP